jgi:hypothetical protein
MLNFTQSPDIAGRVPGDTGADYLRAIFQKEGV